MVCMYVKLSRTTVICAVVIAVLKKKKNQKHKPAGNSESEGSCLTTVYPCGLLCDSGGGRWDSGWCLGTREVGGVGAGRLALPPSLSPSKRSLKRGGQSLWRWLNYILH